MKNREMLNENVRIDMQVTGERTNDYLEKKIDNMVGKLHQCLPDIDAVDISFRDAEAQPEGHKTMTVRCELPGQPLVASDTGPRWKDLIRNVEKKLLPQLEKRRSSIKRGGLAEG